MLPVGSFTSYMNQCGMKTRDQGSVECRPGRKGQCPSVEGQCQKYHLLWGQKESRKRVSVTEGG